MLSIQEILHTREPAHGSERNSILKEIYDFYYNDRFNRKIENWKRYIIWLKNNKIPNNESSQKAFRKSKLFIKILSPKVIAIKLSHIPTNDLYYLKAICKEKRDLKESIGAYILGSIKPKLTKE